MRTHFAALAILACSTMSLAQDWAQAVSGTTKALRKVFFINETHGWAVGDQNTILASTDGGATWNAQVSPSSNGSLKSVFFTSTTHGWIAGAGGTLLRTVNGGATWTSVTSGTSVELRCIWFATPEIGYVAGGEGLTGRILRTTNGGTTWTGVNVQGMMHAIQFTSPTTGWACGARGAIYKTTNGTTWVEQQPFGSNSFQWFTSISMVNENEGWVAGTSPSNALPSLMYTSNGGEDWVTKYSGTQAGKSDVQFFNGQEGWLSTSSPLGGGFPLRRTTDGLTWTTDDLQLPTLHDMHFLSPTLAWAVGDAGTIVKLGALIAGTARTPEAPRMHLAPNPVREHLRVHTTEAILGMEVITIDGRTTGRVQRVGNGVDVSGLVPGTYLLRVSLRNGAAPSTLRFVKE